MIYTYPQAAQVINPNQINKYAINKGKLNILDPFQLESEEEEDEDKFIDNISQHIVKIHRGIPTNDLRYRNIPSYVILSRIDRYISNQIILYQNELDPLKKFRYYVRLNRLIHVKNQLLQNCNNAFGNGYSNSIIELKPNNQHSMNFNPTLVYGYNNPQASYYLRNKL